MTDTDITDRLIVSGSLLGTSIASFEFAYLALDKALNSAYTRAAIIQAELAHSPEITGRIYQTATDTAERLTGGISGYALAFAAMSGLCAGLTLIGCLQRITENQQR